MIPLICLLLFIASAQSFQIRKTIHCDELDTKLLSQILGPAFNSRYMSIQQPVFDEDNEDVDGIKREVAAAPPPFYVEDDYAREIADAPAWSVNHVENFFVRRKRAVKHHAQKTARQWECESKITWVDLGPDYFPRYLRSVECTSKTCWYGHYKCRPRSFTVKVLRRKSGRCTVAKAGTQLGIEGLPSELRQLWVWEERAVNFCCDCAL